MKTPEPDTSTPIKNKKAFEKHLDLLWRTAIRIRDNGLDQYALIQKYIKKKGANAHHIFSRRNKNTRWDLDNGIYLAGMHNMSKAHTEPEEFREFLINKWFKSKRKFDTLYLKSRIITHHKLGDLLGWELYLVTELTKLKVAGKGLDVLAIKQLPKYIKLRIEYGDLS